MSADPPKLGINLDVLVCPARVVIVDDRGTARNLLEALVRSLEPGLIATSFSDPREALVQMTIDTPDLIITDYRMPGMNGLEFTRQVRSDPRWRAIPLLFITADSDRDIRYQALEYGATDFLTRPIDPQECSARCRNLLALQRHQKAMSDRAHWLEDQVFSATHELRAREHELLLKLAWLGEFRIDKTGGHATRIAKYSRLIAEALRLNAMECDEIEVAAPLHDIGEIGIPDAILLKPGRHTPAEQEIMRAHPMAGHEILVNGKSRYLRLAAKIALGHHEKFDGSGHPCGIAGDTIPLEARIVAVADVFDALVSDRPHRRAWMPGDALNWIRAESGRHFDPACVEAFVRCADAVTEIASASDSLAKVPSLGDGNENAPDQAGLKRERG